MRLLLLIQLIIFSFFPTEKKLDLRGTWVIVEHREKDQYGNLQSYSFDQNYPSIILYLIRIDSIVVMCGDGRPSKFFGHFILDNKNNVKLDGLGNDRNMMLPIAQKFTRKAFEINKLSLYNDTLKFFLKANNEEFAFIRMDTIEHGFDKCNAIVNEFYK